MMKKVLTYIFLAAAVIFSASCVDLDQNPLSAASSGNWYSTPEEVEISLNDLYRPYLYETYDGWFLDRRTDDWSQRSAYVYEIAKGTITSTWSNSTSNWGNAFKGVSRANRVIIGVDKLENSGAASAEVADKLRGEASFFRAYFYSKLITLFGAVPLYTGDLTIDESWELGRTDVPTVLAQIYKDFDYAAETLPLVNTGSGLTRISKGAAYAMKARIALYQKDYATARDAAKACMDLNQYSLYPDFGDFFRSKSITSETIFAIARSYELGFSSSPTSFVMRTAGGNGVAGPSWDLLASFLCTDGLPIDESPLFDPHYPMKNRDPRCSYTIAGPGDTLSGYIFRPDPVEKVLNVSTGQLVANKDSKANDKSASNVGTMNRKGVNPEWTGQAPSDGTKYNENPYIIMRYADVLLMYAEAKIELNEIDQSVLDAINTVRARAYKVSKSDVSKYPAVTTTAQAKLRQILRTERRMEFAWEGRRYFDLQRWQIFDKAFSHDIYCLVAPADITKNKDKYYDKDGNFYLWLETPSIDEDGFADFTPMFNNKEIAINGQRFFDEKIYLWPIPNNEVEITNHKIEQNPDY